jgi:hypothetical protein
MQTTIQTPATPGAAAPDGQAPVPTTISTTGPDGKTRTVTIQTGGGPIVGGTVLAPVPPVPPSRSRNQMGPGVAIGIVLTLAVFGLIAAFRRVGRGQARRAPQLPSDSAERLERVERGMEAIAIEIERISEGQRFVTKLMSESRARAIPVDQSKSAG